MGGTPKQLLKRGDHSLLDHVLGEALGSELDIVVLVLGYMAEAIKSGLKTDLNNGRIKIVENGGWMRGISSSIIAGLCEVEDRYDFCMVILADMPHITAKLINQLLNRVISSGLPLGAIKKGNRRSLPCIFRRELYREIHQLKGDSGARKFFLRYQNRACLVEPDEEYDDRDIDTPEDYASFRKAFIGG